jgi:hypothetical protein
MRVRVSTIQVEVEACVAMPSADGHTLSRIEQLS